MSFENVSKTIFYSLQHLVFSFMYFEESYVHLMEYC